VRKFPRCGTVKGRRPKQTPDRSLGNIDFPLPIKQL
jgi:hypothetical protein